MFEIIMTVVGGIFVVVGGVGFWQYLISRKEAPIKVREADLAVASTTQAMALQIAADLRTDLNQLRQDLAVERGERQKLEGRQEGFEAQMRALDQLVSTLRSGLQTFSYAWDEITANWATHRLQDAPPPKPTVKLH